MISRLTNEGTIEVQLAEEHVQRVLWSLERQHIQENAALETMNQVDRQIPAEEKTWLESMKEEVM